ncbi:hypothetical protein EON67_09735 [archaeon]|nr:MAG: hypothetical protein EON67_09735 [archaeon]
MLACGGAGLHALNRSSPHTRRVYVAQQPPPRKRAQSVFSTSTHRPRSCGLACGSNGVHVCACAVSKTECARAVLHRTCRHEHGVEVHDLPLDTKYYHADVRPNSRACSHAACT